VQACVKELVVQVLQFGHCEQVEGVVVSASMLLSLQKTILLEHAESFN